MTKKCSTPNCTDTVGPIYPNPSVGPTNNVNCNTNTGTCTARDNCSPFQLDKLLRDNCFVDGISNELSHIAGATFNVYKLLGVHEQGRLVDATGQGAPLSNGDWPLFPASNAYDIYATEWRSVQRGAAVLPSAYIGYDFGEIKTSDRSRRAYSVDTSIYKHITAISIKQSANPLRRSTRLRVERSDNGSKWYGVAIITLPDNDCLTTATFKASVPSRYWRFRPVSFNGVAANEVWSVQALQLHHNYEATEQYNVQDKILLENRDRDYATDAIPLKGTYDLTDVSTELTRFGIELPSQNITAQLNFSSCVLALGRPIVIGDIVELPSEAQYTSDMTRIEKWLEVTDVSWSTDGYTPGWQPTNLRVTLEPAYISQETQDLFGDIAAKPIEGELGLIDGENGQHPLFQDYFDVDQTIHNVAKDAVPERGAEASNTIREFTDEEKQAAINAGLPNIGKLGLNPTGLYVEDAMPPNNAPYTQGTSFPVSPKQGDYHRMTYEGVDVPARLYRYSTAKNRWIFLEQDKRSVLNHSKPILQEFLRNGNVASDKIAALPRDRVDDNS